MKTLKEIRMQRAKFLDACDDALFDKDLKKANKFLGYANVLAWVIDEDQPMAAPSSRGHDTPAPHPTGTHSPGGAGTSFIKCGDGAVPFENKMVF